MNIRSNWPSADRSQSTESNPRYWVEVAVRQYGFEQATAQRLAFLRWLRISRVYPDDQPCSVSADTTRAASSSQVG
jgi:hypothetical protein